MFIFNDLQELNDGPCGSGSGFELDIDLTDFGYKSFVSGTLEGKLYDTKFSKNGKPRVNKRFINNSHTIFNQMYRHTVEIVHDFTSGSWNPRSLASKYFSPEKKLYASFWIIPMTNAPAAYDAQDEVTPRAILAHYSGSFVPAETGRFRLAGSLNNNYTKIDQDQYDTGQPMFGIGARPALFGRWINWKESIPLDIDVLIGEAPGGRFGAYLLYQKDGEEKLRIFSTKPLTDKEKERLRRSHRDAANLL